MTIICKNCNHKFSGHFCNTCGQSAETHEMNIHFLWHDIQHGLLHLDKGILFTAKEVFTRPGNSIREFLEGKRVKHFKPISLLLVLAGIYGLLFHYSHINIFEGSFTITGKGKEIESVKNNFEKITEWISTHYAIVSLLELPVLALGTFIAFKKYGYNFVEHLIINAFLTGQKLIFHILLFPLVYFYNGTAYLKNINNFENIIGFGLTAWTFIEFFSTQKKWPIFLKVVLSYLIYFAVFVAIAASVGVVIIKTNT